jgi:hypothetical protein
MPGGMTCGVCADFIGAAGSMTGYPGEAGGKPAFMVGFIGESDCPGCGGPLGIAGGGPVFIVTYPSV